MEPSATTQVKQSARGGRHHSQSSIGGHVVRESRFSYAGLSALYPVGEEDTDDEDLEIPKSGRISSRPCHNILTREAVGMADQSPTGAILRDMETSSLNYYSSSSCTGSSSSQPVIHPLGKLRDDDLEAARFYQEPNVAAIDSEHMPEDELKLTNYRNPAEWMTADDTVGISFLFFTVALQLAVIVTNAVYLRSSRDAQLSWKVGCWGSWNSLSGADGVEWVVFETYLGWKLYGKEPTMGWLTDIDHSTAMVGALSGGMHGLTLLFMCGFLLFSSATLWLTYFYRLPEENAGIAIATCEEANKEARYETRSATGGGAWAGAQSPAGPRSFTAHVCRLVLGRSCHSWLLPMGMIMMFAGLWCSLVGCLAFYLFVTTDFTHGLEALLSSWGESVTCAEPETSPRYGFFVNALAAFLLVGGGGLCLYRAVCSERELREVVCMWRTDREEMAEFQARGSLIRKRKAHSRAMAASAAMTAGGGNIGGGTKSPGHSSVSEDIDWSASTPSFPSQLPRPLSPRGIPQSRTAARQQQKKKKKQQREEDQQQQQREEGQEIPTRLPSDSFFPGPHRALANRGAQLTALAQKPADMNQMSPRSPQSEYMVTIQQSGVEGEKGGGGGGCGGDGGADEELPPPSGWDKRSTPSGEKFWVNMITKAVSWERPTV